MSYIIIKSTKQPSTLKYKIYKDNDGFDNKSIAWESNSINDFEVNSLILILNKIEYNVMAGMRRYLALEIILTCYRYFQKQSIYNDNVTVTEYLSNGYFIFLLL